MTVRTTLRAHAGSAAAARRFVADVLSQRGFPIPGIEDAVLLASEAVNFAIGLGGTTMALEVLADPSMTRVEVHLLGRQQPASGSLVPDPPPGPGSVVMKALAEDFAFEPHGPGARCVWFEIRA